MEPSKERRKVLGAVIASLIVHFIVAFSLAAVGRATPSGPEDDKPVELTFVDLPPPTPPPLVPKNTPFIDTTRESETAPTEKTFESHANSIAAAEKPASGDLPLPSQDGKERPNMELETQQYSLASKGTPAPPVPTPQPTSTPQPTATPLPTSTPSATPPSTPTPVPTPKPTATPEPEQLAMLTATPPPPMQPQPEDSAEPIMPAPATTPAPTARPKPDAPSTAYQPQKQKTRVSGKISNRGPSAVNAIGTPLGRYEKLLKDAIGSRWYYYVEKQRDLISIGTAEVRFWIDRNGRVKNLKLVENSSNEAFANVCLQSVAEIQLPPIPEDVASALPPEGLEVTEMSFTMFAN